MSAYSTKPSQTEGMECEPTDSYSVPFPLSMSVYNTKPSHTEGMECELTGSY